VEKFSLGLALDATLPPFFEMKGLHDHVCELEDGPACVCDDLGGDVDEYPAQGDRQGGRRDDGCRVKASKRKKATSMQ